MTWVAVGIALAAAAASAYNTQRTARKQDEAIAAGIREKNRVQQRADKRISDELDQLQRSTSKLDQQGAIAQYQEALRGTQQQAQAGQALAGLSQDYDAATNAAQAQTGSNVSQVADALSRIDAAGLQRQREGMRVGDLGTDLRLLGREAEGIDFLSNLRAQGVRRNPYLDALAAGLNAYGGGMSTAGGATGKTKTGGNRRSGTVKGGI